MYGRGSTDDKGPIMGWLNVLEAHQAQGLELPVNLRFCFEGMEESGSEGLDELIAKEVAEGSEWFKGIDCVCIVRHFPIPLLYAPCLLSDSFFRRRISLTITG